MSDDLLAEFRARHPIYERLASRASAVLAEIVAQAGIEAQVKCRAKNPAHAYIKVQTKRLSDPDRYRDPLAEMGDLAGARIVVTRLSHAELMCEAVRSRFVVHGDIDDKIDGLAPDALGYLGLHIQVSLSESDLGGDEDLRGLQCELQIHTLAQSAWSSVAHQFLYKPPGGLHTPPEMQRRIFRAVSLVSLFDDEIRAALDYITGLAEFVPAVMLDVLAKAALDWCPPADIDREASMQILGVVQSAFTSDDLATFDHLMEEFMTLGRGKNLTTILDQYDTGAGAPDLLFQPEAIAIFERLVQAPQLLRARWIESSLPNALLEETASALGLGFAD